MTVKYLGRERPPQFQLILHLDELGLPRVGGLLDRGKTEGVRVVIPLGRSHAEPESMSIFRDQMIQQARKVGPDTEFLFVNEIHEARCLRMRGVSASLKPPSRKRFR